MVALLVGRTARARADTAVRPIVQKPMTPQSKRRTGEWPAGIGLASGGGIDGVVRLWDRAHPEADKPAHFSVQLFRGGHGPYSWTGDLAAVMVRCGAGCAGATPTRFPGDPPFTLYGPDNATCSGTSAFTSTVPVNGNGQYTSEPFTPSAPG